MPQSPKGSQGPTPPGKGSARYGAGSSGNASSSSPKLPTTKQSASKLRAGAQPVNPPAANPAATNPVPASPAPASPPPGSPASKGAPTSPARAEQTPSAPANETRAPDQADAAAHPAGEVAGEILGDVAGERPAAGESAESSADPSTPAGAPASDAPARPPYAPYGSQGPQPFRPHPRPPSLKPRRVRGGVRLHSDQPPGSGSWAAARLVRLLESVAEGARLVEGLEYAKLGQTARMNFDQGMITATVQGRIDKPYRASLSMSTYSEAQWIGVVQAMSDQAMYAAKLLAGELPASIEDLFAPVGLKLFPSEPADLTPACTCGDEQRWCKHICCMTYLLAEKFAGDPFLIFLLRGIPGEDLLEKIRQRRAIAGAVGGTVPVYAARVPGVSDISAPGLDECVEHFWESGPELEQFDAPMDKPQVTHPLLRRLGPSPFQDPKGTTTTGAPKFPLVGLLATCYEMITEATLKEAEGQVLPDRAVDPNAEDDAA